MNKKGEKILFYLFSKKIQFDNSKKNFLNNYHVQEYAKFTKKFWMNFPKNYKCAITFNSTIYYAYWNGTYFPKAMFINTLL